MKIKCFLNNVQLLLLSAGVGFVLYSSSGLQAALGMSASVVIVFVLTALVMSLLDKVVSPEYRFYTAAIVGVGFATLVNMLLEAFFPGVAGALGIYAVVVGLEAAVIPASCEAAEKKCPVMPALASGIAFTVVAVISSVIRELLGNASIFGVKLGFLDGVKIKTLAGTVGAYIVVAAVLACISAIASGKEDKEVK